MLKPTLHNSSLGKPETLNLKQCHLFEPSRPLGIWKCFSSKFKVSNWGFLQQGASQYRHGERTRAPKRKHLAACNSLLKRGPSSTPFKRTSQCDFLRTPNPKHLKGPQVRSDLLKRPNTHGTRLLSTKAQRAHAGPKTRVALARSARGQEEYSCLQELGVSENGFFSPPT